MLKQLLHIAFIVLGFSSWAVPAEFAPLILAGDSCMQEKNYADAIFYYEKARRFDTNFAPLNQNLILAYEQTENTAKSIFISQIESSENFYLNPRFLPVLLILNIVLLILSLWRIGSIILSTRSLGKLDYLIFSVFILIVILTLNSYPVENLATSTEDNTQVYEATSVSSEVITSVQPGYKFIILELYDDWAKVQLATNTEGWVETKGLNLN